MRTFAVLGPAGSGKSTLIARLAALESGPVAREEADHLALTSFAFMGERWAAMTGVAAGGW